MVELVVAVAVVMAGLLSLSRSMTESLALGEKNRETALATAAAQGIVEELYAADFERAFALYNDEPDDDPDGSGTAPGSRFAAAGLEARPQDAGQHGRIFFPATGGTPGELREDMVDSRLRVPLDLNLDGFVDGADHSGDYRILPVLIRVTWQDGTEERELEVTTILGAR
jgi:type II secretory pathway pseudopilin PulG